MSLIRALGMEFLKGKSRLRFDSDLHADLIKSGIFVVVDGEGEELYIEFVCPLIRRAFMYVAFPPEFQEPYPSNNNLYQFVKDCLRQFRTKSFSETLSIFPETNFPESKFNVEFFYVARKLLGTRGKIDPEVGKVFLIDVESKSPAVDFYINGDLKWAIELMVEGDRLREHLGRFRSEGKYIAIPRSDHIIVDFRKVHTENLATQTRKTPFVNENDKYLQVRYLSDFKKLYLRYGNESTVDIIELLEE
ncbi:MAG: hypothetical protein K2X39_00165 [Silvanigrellaceae bacterium]|nr:hypothetical protein [Silvanigrellaceae bacterium]